MTHNSFGSALRSARVAAGKTQEAVAKRIGVSVPYISDIERGNRLPLDDEKIRVLADYLGVHADVLFVAAAQSRGAYRLPSITSKHSDVAGMLMAAWPRLSADALNEITETVGRCSRREVGGR